MQSKALQKPIRESGIELLRILMMLQVIFLHVCSSTHGGFTGLAEGGDLGDGTLLLYRAMFYCSRRVCLHYFDRLFLGNEQQDLFGCASQAAENLFSHAVLLHWDSICRLGDGNVGFDKHPEHQSLFPVSLQNMVLHDAVFIGGSAESFPQ